MGRAPVACLAPTGHQDLTTISAECGLLHLARLLQGLFPPVDTAVGSLKEAGSCGSEDMFV